mgnify:CR=1 FL=1
MQPIKAYLLRENPQYFGSSIRSHGKTSPSTLLDDLDPRLSAFGVACLQRIHIPFEKRHWHRPRPSTKPRTNLHLLRQSFHYLPWLDQLNLHQWFDGVLRILLHTVFHRNALPDDGHHFAPRPRRIVESLRIRQNEVCKRERKSWCCPSECCIIRGNSDDKGRVFRVIRLIG